MPQTLLNRHVCSIKSKWQTSIFLVDERISQQFENKNPLLKMGNREIFVISIQSYESRPGQIFALNHMEVFQKSITKPIGSCSCSVRFQEAY